MVKLFDKDLWLDKLNNLIIQNLYISMQKNSDSLKVLNDTLF